jgi:hypothetical protein
MSRVLAASSVLLALALPAVARAATPELSATDRLDDRRYAAIGSRAYVVGTQAGRYPAMGFHTRGEMGGVWTPPIKLLDGVWFGIDGSWIGPATRFTSGAGHVRMELPGRDGLTVTRTDVVPDGARGVLIGLRFRAGDTEQRFTLDADAHSELMSIYPWGETTPLDQRTFNLADEAAYGDGDLVFTERGTPPGADVEPHDWAAAVGAAAPPSAHQTGAGFRGPQEPAVVCGPSGEGTPEPPDRCDDTAYGRGQGGRLSYEITVPAGGSTSFWLGVAGSEEGAGAARAELRRLLDDPAEALEAKLEARERLARRTRLSLPGDPLLEQGVDWSKQNLADSVQDVRDLELRVVSAGKAYPPPVGELDRARFLGAGWPDYPWLFATDGEYTAFASVALGQFEPIVEHLRALRDASRTVNGSSGKVVHEVITDGSVYFGALSDPGNTDETAKFPSTVALLWRWTGDRALLREMYGFARDNMRYIVDELDADGDGWPEGLGNVEREGMGEEKLDNTVYTIRGLWDLADLADARGDGATERWATGLARDLTQRFDGAWWMPEVPGFADSLREPNDERSFQRHWITATPMEVELVRDRRAAPGLAAPERAAAALDLHATPCFGDASGFFHTGRAGCDGAPAGPDELQSFTLNTSIVAVGEGNYGRLGPDAQRRWTTALAAQQVPGVEQPGAMPEIASPSPRDGDILDRPFNGRPMVLQAWGAYGTAWPVVHQQLGVRPDLGRDRLEVVPQLPSDAPIAGRDIRLGDGGHIDVSAARDGERWRTRVRLEADVRLWIGHTLPAGTEVGSVRLDGDRVRFQERVTNRGVEVLVRARGAGTHTLSVRAAG